MKKYIVIHMILLSFLSMAQSEMPLFEEIKKGNKIPFSKQMSYIISDLDKREINTGILADKSILFSSMDDFTGTNSKKIALSTWKQIYRQLFVSQIDSKVLFSPDNLPKPFFDNERKSDVIPIAILNIDYNQFREEPIKNNLLEFKNSKLRKTSKTTPYIQKKVFVATPLKDKVFSNQVIFKISSRLIIQNSEKQLLSINIDFDDGNGYVNVFNRGDQEQYISIDYPTVGDKIIKTKVYYDDGSVLQSNSDFSILLVNTNSYDSYFQVSGSWGGGTSTGTAYVLYGCGNNNQLRKPIIVSDGFDPTNERHFNKIYGLMNREHLIEKLLSDGFDVIILDYNSGADYIQRNAQVLISVINEINSQLASNKSNAELVIVGPSMAGLISRYALSYMEQNNINHNTRLYISFDSPHLGANIPLGDQYWLDFFASIGESQGAIEGRAQLNSIAAKQMLVYHFSTFPNQNILRTNLINDPYFSFPTMCRKIAFSNGSKNNSSHYFEPSTQIISYRYRDWKVDIDGNVWAVPDHPSSPKTIFYGRIDKIFPLPDYEREIKIDGNIYPYDGAAGGCTNTNEEIAAGDTEGYGDIETDYPNHSFIPMVSSLALSSSNYEVNTSFDVSNLPNYHFINDLSITPFDAIYAPTSNQEHIEVTSETVNWMMQEIGASELYLQNKIIIKPTDFQARNTIKTGRSITNSTPQGDFVVQNNSGITNITAGNEIILKAGTNLKPIGNGTIHIFTSPYPCATVDYIRNASYSKNYNKEELISDLPLFSNKTIAKKEMEVYMKAFPNPFFDYINIEYLLKEKSDIQISIYNLNGEKIKNVVDMKNVNAGKHITRVDVGKLVSGMYICVISQNGEINGVMKIEKQN